MYLTKTPTFIQKMFPSYTWRMPTFDQVKKVYLTFDDGPIPEVTPWVMDLLDKYNAKGTFFCVGDNIRKYPHIHNELIERGHVTGNHTFNHLSGWTTENLPYYHNIRKCARLTSSKLFRPPYGRMKPSQGIFLSRHYQIVMWDILSGDFDPLLSAKECYKNVISNVKPGSIIVFHDSIKSNEKLRQVLPRVLNNLSQRGYSFESVTAQNMNLIENKIPA